MSTKQERIARFYNRMAQLGFDYDEASQLRRIELTLQRWAERECGTDNGCIERDETTGKPYWLNSATMKRYPIADKERGALKRLAGIVARHAGILAYHQGDCRGCMLYLVRAEDVRPGESLDSVYTRGVAVCY